MSAGLLLAGVSAVVGGMLVAAQGPIYARLSKDLNRDTLAAVFVAFSTATLATGLLTVGSGSWRSISLPALAALPAWVWLGGLLGACHVVISMHTIPVVGVTAFLVLVIVGNLVGASIYDHLGAFGLAERPFGMVRLLGLLLVLVGVLVVVRA
ncbi:MAG: DMT family transporter [Pseudomonadota bacterium]